MVATKAHGLTPFFMVYKQEALIPARPMAVDMIFPHFWDFICEDEWAYTKELVTIFAAQKLKVAERLKRPGDE